jgi:hypothetical protein
MWHGDCREYEDSRSAIEMLLLIDDDRGLRETLAEFLALEGYAVHSVAYGCEPFSGPGALKHHLN